MNSIKFSTKYGLQDFYEMNKLNFLSSNWKYLFFVTGAIQTSFLLTGIAVRESGAFVGVIINGFFALSFLTFPWTWLRWLAYGTYKKSPNFHDAYIWEIDENGLRAENKFEKSDSKWSSFSNFRYNGRILLLYKTDRAYCFMFPKRLVTDDDWDRLLNLTKNKIVK